MEKTVTLFVNGKNTSRKFFDSYFIISITPNKNRIDDHSLALYYGRKPKAI